MQKQGAYGFVILGGIINNRGKVVLKWQYWLQEEQVILEATQWRNL